MTDFGGVAIPTSMDEILAQLEPTITLPCPDGFFAPYILTTSNPNPTPPTLSLSLRLTLTLTRFIYGESPLLYTLILGLTVLNLMSIAFFRYRCTLRS